MQQEIGVPRGEGKKLFSLLFAVLGSNRVDGGVSVKSAGLIRSKQQK